MKFMVQFMDKNRKWTTVSKHELPSEAHIELAQWRLRAIIGGSRVKLRVLGSDGNVWVMLG